MPISEEQHTREKFIAYLRGMREAINNDKEFMSTLLNKVAHRDTHQHLNYDTLAIKLARTLEYCEKTTNKILYCLLYDDRHDLWQNLPFYLDAYLTENVDENGDVALRSGGKVNPDEFNTKMVDLILFCVMV